MFSEMWMGKVAAALFSMIGPGMAAAAYSRTRPSTSLKLTKPLDLEKGSMKQCEYNRCQRDGCSDQACQPQNGITHDEHTGDVYWQGLNITRMDNAEEEARNVVEDVARRHGAGKSEATIQQDTEVMLAVGGT